MSEGSTWFAKNPSKAWCEKFFLTYSFVWVGWFLGILIPFKLYEGLGNLGYFIVTLSASLPCVLYPLFFGPEFEKDKPVFQRFWFKANLWIFVFGYIGNYFWTHYFYDLLDSSYDLDIVRHNNVPFAMFIMTQPYFCLYHALSNITIRKVKYLLKSYSGVVQKFAIGVTIFLLSYFLAFMETFSISAYPYYSFKDRNRMYTVGSLFYAIYFFFSFPIFFEMDEDITKPKYNTWDVIKSSLAAGMGVTLVLDWWRLFIGGINNSSNGQKISWMQ